MSEAILIIRKISLRKLWNAALRTAALALSRLLGRYVNWGMPWSYSIEPCNVCNLKCRECASGLGRLERRRGMIEPHDFRLAVDSIAPYALNLFLYFQGEPTLHPQFAEMVEYATRRNIFTATSTNGHFLTPELCGKIVRSGLGKIIVSLDGGSQSEYESYRRGGNFQKVVEGIRNLKNAKHKLKSSSPVIEVQTLVTKINENSLKEIERVAMDAGADRHILKSMQIENVEDFEVFKTSNDRFSRYDGNNRLKKTVGFCPRVFNSAVISIDLDVVPCCYDKDCKMPLGNLRKMQLEKIIKSGKAGKIINHIEYQKDKRPPMCYNCGG